MRVSSGASRTSTHLAGSGLAVGETVILLAPPSPFSRRFNSDGEKMSAKWHSLADGSSGPSSSGSAGRS